MTSKFGSQRDWNSVASARRTTSTLFDPVTTLVGRFLPVIVAMAMSLTTVSAQTGGKISGKIIDEVTGEALAGCNVMIAGTPMGASTDIDGSYFILNVAAGKYDVQASYLGYQKVLQRDVIVNSGKTTVADFRLRPSALLQQEVVIEAKRPDVERDKTSTSTVIRSEDVGQIAGMRDIGDVIGLAADVTDGHFRGGRANEEYYLLQGMGIVNPLDASAAFRPILSAVEEVEVITSGMSAQYGNAQSGVVNITMKEGKADRWTSRFEARVRAPGLKYFGPSVYDSKANPYMLRLADQNFWLHGDSTSGYVPPLNWTNQALGGDTAVMTQLAQSIWKSATSRDMNSKYWKSQIDYSVEGATGGPLSDGIRMFMALRSEVENQIVPTEQPDKRQQVMGNAVFDLGEGAALRLSGGYQYEFNNILGGNTGFYSWIWDRILGEEYQEKTNAQFGVRFSKAMSASTFYDIKLNGLRTTNRLGSSPYYDTITDKVLGMETGSGIIQRTMNFTFYQGLQKSFFYLANNLGDFDDDGTLTFSLDAAYTSQVTKSHLINGGIQANYYSIKVSEIGNIRSKGSITQLKYTGHPYQLGMYVQDKMEFEGMIANVGLRWDFWSSNNTYFGNQFDPFVIPDSLGNPTIFYDPARATKLDAKPVGRLQPRVGVSFPTSMMTVFHLNYGTFMQNPSFQYVLGSQQRMPTPPQTYPLPGNLGNPRLKPQVTNQYDVGVMQGLGVGFTLDVSGYYKDIKDLIDQAIFVNTVTGVSYNSWFNRDYADVRGFRIQLSKRTGTLSGSINYNFSVATGKSSTASNAPVTITKDVTGTVSTDAVKLIPVKDVLLNFDRTHNLIVNVAYSTRDQFGPKIFGAYPMDNMIFSVSSFARSGRPYTPPHNALAINTARSPAEYNTNIRVSKYFKNLGGVGATFYVEVFNLFENRILNYNYLFNTANKTDQNQASSWYEDYSLDDPRSGVMYWDQQNTATAYGVNHSFLLYSNSPRSYNVGIALDF